MTSWTVTASKPFSRMRSVRASFSAFRVLPIRRSGLDRVSSLRIVTARHLLLNIEPAGVRQRTHGCRLSVDAQTLYQTQCSATHSLAGNRCGARSEDEDMGKIVVSDNVSLDGVI